MPVIDDFMDRFSREYDYFLESARLAAQRIEKVLHDNGIRAIVTFRAKRPERLRAKLEQRHNDKPYGCLEDIYADIADLAGVRIALYFPGDLTEVDKIIRADFNVQAEKHFPEETRKPSPVYAKVGYTKRFSGYWARHYRLKMKGLPLEQARYEKATVEVQVASVLMHAWAEVEHDLVYKPFSGLLSREEYAILDELNGLVLAGEIALENLQLSGKMRLSAQGQSFNNHFELASFLKSVLPPPPASGRRTKDRKEPAKHEDDAPVGRTDVLFRFLQLLGENRADVVAKHARSVRNDQFTSFRIADRLIGTDLEKYRVYLRARQEIEEENPYGSSPGDKDALEFFLSRWVIWEEAARRLLSEDAALFRPADLEPLESLGIEPSRLAPICTFRNRVVHGLERPRSRELIELGTALESSLRKLRDNLDEPIRSEIERASAGWQPVPDLPNSSENASDTPNSES